MRDRFCWLLGHAVSTATDFFGRVVCAHCGKPLPHLALGTRKGAWRGRWHCRIVIQPPGLNDDIVTRGQYRWEVEAWDSGVRGAQPNSERDGLAETIQHAAFKAMQAYRPIALVCEKLNDERARLEAAAIAEIQVQGDLR